jgi:pectate lyase-like protein
LAKFPPFVVISFAAWILCVSHQSAWAGVIDVTVPPYSAAGDGSTDDTDAINRALRTGRTIYLPASKACYRTSSPLVMTTPNQLVYGDGRTRSKICPGPSRFDGGVIEFRTAEVGPQLRDIGIFFSQPDTKLRADLRQYEPAILAKDTPRFRLRGVRISLAWVGIDMTGNSGGALIDDLEMSAFSKGIWVDGSLDSVRLNDIHSWVFDMTPNQREAFFDHNAVSFEIGRCDDCQIRGGLSMAGTAMHFYRGSTGYAFGSISNFAFDTNNGINISAGVIDASSVYFTLNPNARVEAIHMTGGTLNVSTFWALAGPTVVPMVDVLSEDTKEITALNMANGKISLGRQDATFLLTTNQGGQIHVGLSNNFFDATPNVVHLNPVISISRNSRLQAMGNQISDKGAGTGTYILVQSDDWHRIVYNASVGWENKFPVATLGIYGPN